MMRRLPVYILLDESGDSTIQKQMEIDLKTFLYHLRKDPYALETVFLSIIRFGACWNAKNPIPVQVSPLEEIAAISLDDSNKANDVQCISVPLGAALKLVVSCVQKEVIKPTPTSRGDWSPNLILMSVNPPTDDWKIGLEALKNIKWGGVNLIDYDVANKNVLAAIVKHFSRTGNHYFGFPDAKQIQLFDPWCDVEMEIREDSDSVSFDTLPSLTDNTQATSDESPFPPVPPIRDLYGI